MRWFQRYRLRIYLRDSLWILPALSIILALICVRLLVQFERSRGWQMSLRRETAQLIMGTVAASTFTLLVLLCSAVLVAVQLSSAQLTPRIIAFIYRNNYRKLALAVFVFTFTFSVGILVRLDETVPWLSSYLAAYGFLVNLALFILFIDNIGKNLRPSSALRQVGLAGRQVIRSVYPFLLRPGSMAHQAFKSVRRENARVILSDEDGAVLAFNLKGLVALASRRHAIIELVPEVGDFIAAGDPLFRVYGGDDKLADNELRNYVAIGHERTLEQDPMFAFRVIVDIASKALSPAVNDPTTAVLALDQIHHLLRDVGKRSLADGQEEGAHGHLRLIYRTPDWEDFVQLGTTEIRHYGRESIQVQRRLRAMLEDLLQTLPPRRHAILQKELALLGVSVQRSFPDFDDQALAKAGDLQGIGGGDESSETAEPASATATR
jgi:uncharacterized membrane protein